MQLLKIPCILFLLLLPYGILANGKVSPQKQITTNALITAPTDGETVQGGVIVQGSTGMEGFLSYEIDFAYENLPIDTWFLVHESNTAVQDGILAVWDTTTISDGVYSLRLTVNFTDGVSEEVLVKGVRVRNYSPIETNTPGPIVTVPTIEPGAHESSLSAKITETPTDTTNPPTPTPLPTNPAELMPHQVRLSIGKGIALTLGIFALLGGYLGIQALRNKHR
jgi:hypothetical protein